MKHFWRWAFAAAFLTVSWLSLTPQEALPSIRIWDKLAHALAFGALMALARLGWRAPGTFTIAALLLGYGLFVEVAQRFIPGRSFSLLDLVADGVGIAVAAIALAWVVQTRPSGRNP